jgi:hypothetical protein
MTIQQNPFQITSPEDLSAQETVSLFVDVFTDFQKIIDPGHIFLIGPRGAGKSMMFRYLQPDCQCLAKNCAFSEIPYLGIYVPLKNTNFTLPELKRLEHRNASEILNEHILVTHFCVKAFQVLSNPNLYLGKDKHITEVKSYYNDVFLETLYKMIYEDVDSYRLEDNCDIPGVFNKISKIAELLYNKSLIYAKKLAFTKDFLPYDDPLLDYIGFLLPVLSSLSKISIFPQGSIYLLVDDAHWLTETQTQVLNSWVASRTSRKVSLKISTQYSYKTYYCLNGDTIDIPHDYSEIDIATIYTGSSKSKYRERISDIIKKRLTAFGKSNISPEQFFPEDADQEREIHRIEEEYKKKFDNGEGKGFRRQDDALRYSRPDYIKSLSGVSKSSSKYSYAGFNQLVHLSSGVVRHFLHPAHLMYADAKSKNSTESIDFIPPSIQNDIIREEANHYFFTSIEKLQKNNYLNLIPKEDIKKLSNLITGLGGLFRQILLSDRSERRIFSIAFSDDPSDSVLQILELGIQIGYFHRSTIGRKDSKSGGRTRLYVLNRRLAPIWTLDPTGFAGYLFITSKLIEEALLNPISLLRRIAKDGISNTEIIQMELF